MFFQLLGSGVLCLTQIIHSLIVQKFKSKLNKDMYIYIIVQKFKSKLNKDIYIYIYHHCSKIKLNQEIFITNKILDMYVY